MQEDKENKYRHEILLCELILIRCHMRSLGSSCELQGKFHGVGTIFNNLFVSDGDTLKCLAKLSAGNSGKHSNSEAKRFVQEDV